MTILERSSREQRVRPRRRARFLYTDIYEPVHRVGAPFFIKVRKVQARRRTPGGRSLVDVSFISPVGLFVTFHEVASGPPLEDA